MSQQLTASPMSMHTARKSPAIWIGVACAAAVVIGLATWIVLRWSDAREPRLNESTDVLTRFVTSKAFDELPFEKQRQYYKVFDDRDKQIDQAYHDHRLTEGQYRAALEAAWLGKHINRVEKYFALAPGKARADYVAGLLAKKNKKSGHDDHDSIGVDESAAELRVDRWPEVVRDQWNQFHAAYKKEKKARETPSTGPQ